MTAKTEMMQAHEAMASVLDAKLKDMPEWRAFRAIDRALIALETERPAAPRIAPVIRRITPQSATAIPSYVDLTLKAIEEKSQPITTPDLMAFIGQRRQLGSDPEKAKINVISSLSKAKPVKSVLWQGGRAWWYADRAVPKRETAA